MKKIMCINCADQGSTGKIIEDIARYNDQFEFVLCVPRSTRGEPVLQTYQISFLHEQGIYKRIAKLIGLPYGFAPISTCRLLHIIKKEQPDLIHVHCINSNMVNIYRLFRYIHDKRIPVVITNHAEFYYTGSCAHANKCLQWIDGCQKCEFLTYATDAIKDRTSLAWKKMRTAIGSVERIAVVSVSPWVYMRSTKSGIMKGVPQHLILNGVNTQIFCPRDSYEIQHKLRIANRNVVLHVTAGFSAEENDLKGGRFVINLARRYSGYNIFFIVAGNVGKDVSDIELPENMILIGKIDDQIELAQLYSLANVTLLTSRRETFSMPVAESLCCGTPVIGFRAGGPESIAIEEYSEFVDYGNENELAKVLQKWIDVKDTKMSIVCAKYAKEKYDAQIMARKYSLLYEKLLGVNCEDRLRLNVL